MASSVPSGSKQASSSRSGLRPESIEDEELIERLYRLVLRSFYDDKLVVIAEQVLRYQLLPADVLAGRLSIHPRDLAILASRLVDDKMLCQFRRSEKREREGMEAKMQSRSYYHVHPPLFLAMLKYRLHHIRIKIDSSTQSSSYTTSFVCPQCNFTYSTLDVAHLLDFSTNTLRCERPGCGAELAEDEEEGEETRKAKERMRRFNEQCAFMIQALETLEGVDISSIEPISFLDDTSNHKWKSLRPDRSALGDGKDSDSIPYSKQTSMTDAAAPKVSLTDAESSSAAKRAAAEEADRQRKGNAIPDWPGQEYSQRRRDRSGYQGEREREAREQRRGVEAADREIEAEEDDYYAQYAQMQESEDQQQEGAADSIPQVAAPTSRSGKRERSDDGDGGTMADGKRVKAEDTNGASGATANKDDDDDDDDD